MREKNGAEAIVLTISEADAGERLDKVLARQCPQYSRSLLQRWISEGRVLYANEPASRKTRVEAGAAVVVTPSTAVEIGAFPQDIPISILFEDEHLIVVDKPAGLVVHPGAGHPNQTLIHALLYHAQISGGDDPLRPGIVHRLDKDTSGVMVVAKNNLSHERLVELFQARRIERSYLAIVLGLMPPSMTYETLHARHPVDRKKFTSRATRGKPAVTEVQTLEHLFATSLVRCKLKTGRTHQIRVHLAEHGHSILGDLVYGSSIADPQLRAISAAIGRQALHAETLGFTHPVTGHLMRFGSDAPKDFELALAELRRLGTLNT